MQFDIHSEFGEAKQLLNSAYNVFLLDLKMLEQQQQQQQQQNQQHHHTHTTKNTQNDLDKNNNNNNNHNQIMKGGKTVDDGSGAKVVVPAAVAAAAAAATADSAKSKVDENANQNCDINKITINAEIQKFGDVFLQMETDESYELNVTSMSILTFSRYK